MLFVVLVLGALSTVKASYGDQGCLSLSEHSVEQTSRCSCPERGDSITITDALLGDFERTSMLGNMPLSRQHGGETFEIDAPESLVHNISKAFLEAEKGRGGEQQQNGARWGASKNASTKTMFATAQSLSVPYHDEYGYDDGHVALLYLSGSGVLEFMNRASDTVQSVKIVPARMVTWSNRRWRHRVIATNHTRVFLGLHSRSRGKFSSITISDQCVGGFSGFTCSAGWTLKASYTMCSGTCTDAHCCDRITTSGAEATTTAALAEATTTAGATTLAEATTTAGATTLAEATTTAAGTTTAAAGGGATTSGVAGAMYTGYERCYTGAGCYFTDYTKGTHYKTRNWNAGYPEANCAADCLADAECEAFESLSGGMAPSCSFWMNGACDIHAGTSPGPPGYINIPYANFCDKLGARKSFSPVVGKCREGPASGISLALVVVFLAASRFEMIYL